MRRELLHQSCGQPVPNHQEESDHDVVVALVVVQLRVALQDVEDDVNELLLQPLSLVIRHPCGDKALVRWAASPAAPCLHLYQPASSQRMWDNRERAEKAEKDPGS